MPDMATYHAISATGKSIVGLLSDNCPKPEFTGAEFKLWQSADFRQSKRLDFEQMNAVCELVQIRQQPSIVYVARPVTIQRPSAVVPARRRHQGPNL